MAGPLQLGIIYTIEPYLLPHLVPNQVEQTPQMPLVLQENYTTRLLELLRQGELDCAIVALPIPDSGLVIEPLYDEPFVVAVPANHPWAKRKRIDPEELKHETMLLLGSGHCFRDQVLEVCPEFARYSASSEGIQRSFEGSSLETIRHMVAAGLGVTVMPVSALGLAGATDGPEGRLLRYIPFENPVPDRRVVLIWRKSFPRPSAMHALAASIRDSKVPGVQYLDANLSA